jgi:hypothetical protein
MIGRARARLDRPEARTQRLCSRLEIGSIPKGQESGVPRMDAGRGVLVLDRTPVLLRAGGDLGRESE